MTVNSGRGTNTTTNMNTNTRTGSNANTRSTAKYASGLNVIAGLWLIIAPWVLGYSELTAVLWNDMIVGVLIAIFAGIRFAKPLRRQGISWINLVLGIWLIAASVVLPHGVGVVTEGALAFWNDIILGSIVVILSIASADSTNNTV